MEIRCEFVNTSNCGYTCKVSSQQIPENLELKFIGSHKAGKCDNDVISISIENCNITKVPQGLTKKFPNLEVIFILNSNLKKLSKIDLIEYKKLKRLGFNNNEVHFLPGDLFEDFKNLEQISFKENKLTVVEPNILDGLDKLKLVYLNGAVNFGCFNSSSVVPHFDARLIEIKTKLNQEFLKHDSQVITDFMLKQQASLQITKKEVQNLTDELEEEKFKNAANNSKFTADIKNFIQDENFKDFKIKIDDREFHVHKFHLAARSPTLAEILQNNPEAENLNLVDISVENFEKILKFLYTDELPREDGTNFLHLFAAAGRLKIVELKNFAAQKIFTEIDGKNALEILNLSNKYGHEELRQKAFEEIKKNYRKIEFNDEWINDGDKIAKMIKYFKKMAELEEDLKKAMIDN